MTTISASGSAQIPGGPNVAFKCAIEVEAYDRIELVVAPGDSDRVVEIQPGAAGRVRLLLIKSSLYGSEITYKAGDGTMDAPEVALDAPQVFIGSGVIALFMVDPKQLKFANTNTDPERKATVEILVGRDATP